MIRVPILALLGALALSLSACLPPASQSGGGSGSTAPTLVIAVEGRVTALADGGEGSALQRAIEPTTFTGMLSATPSGGGATEEFFWSVTVHEDLTITSNSTVILFPGTYDFDLVVTDGAGGQQYVGSVVGFSIVDGENTVPLVLRPVIGETVVDAAVLERIADFRVRFPELPLLTMTAPHLRLQVDAGAWQDFLLDPASGESVDYLLNLPQGLHQIALELVDGSLLRGRTRVDQGPVDVQPGASLVLDLVSLHGEMVLTLHEEGGAADLAITLPAEAVEEAGGVADLQAHLTLAQGTHLWEEPLALSLNPDGTASATVSLSPLQFGAVTLSLGLSDAGESPAFALGGCAVAAVLSTSGSTVACPLTLHRRALLGGALLSTLGVNVYSAAGEPVPGAEVYVNDVLAGLTGGGAFGTPGYLKIVRTAGAVTVRAESITLGKQGQDSLTLAPLGVHNLALFLDADLIREAQFGYSGAIVPFTVPAGVSSLSIEAWGASGGESTGTPGPVGGRGVRMRGDFSVTPGDLLLVLVGHAGASGYAHGSGGGGSFVARVDAGAADVMAAPAFVGLHVAPLLVAGGGGGIRISAAQDGIGGVTAQYGTTGSGDQSTGGGVLKTADLGLGGVVIAESYGSGGAGFRGDGMNDEGWSEGGTSFLNGGDGGADVNHCAGEDLPGGFGGGGGPGCGGGGGGGGYSGGDGGYIAGGAGSFNGGAAQSNAAGANTGNGHIVISW